ncbi:MAG TPA: histidine kinase [Longimicrobium sp.]
MFCDDDDDPPEGERNLPQDVAPGDPNAPVTASGAVADAFRAAPRSAKLYFLGAGLYIAGITAWIALSRRDALLQAPVWAALLGGGSGVVLGMAVALSRVAQGDRWRQRFKWGIAPKRLTEMLLALPLLAFLSGSAAAAATIVIAGAAWKEPWLLLAAAATLFVVLASGKLLSDSTRYMFFHAREQAAAAGRARAEAADAQLAALQAQVHPHFLFNALNTIAALVRTDPRAAEATTENLARVLRRTLDRTRRTDCTVEDEIDFLRAWLSVERARFGARLRVDFEVDPAAEPLRIPTMTLQPLVENSLKHGIAGKLEGGRVTVRVGGDDGRLRLEVEDDGAGFPREPREGTGLTNLRRRLETIYGGAAELRVERPPHGARVVVELPASPGRNGSGGEPAPNSG